MAPGRLAWPRWPLIRECGANWSELNGSSRPPRRTDWAGHNGHPAGRNLTGGPELGARPGAGGPPAGAGGVGGCHQPSAAGGECGGRHQRRSCSSELSHERSGARCGERSADGNGFPVLPVAVVGSKPLSKRACGSGFRSGPATSRRGCSALPRFVGATGSVGLTALRLELVSPVSSRR